MAPRLMVALSAGSSQALAAPPPMIRSAIAKRIFMQVPTPVLDRNVAHARRNGPDHPGLELQRVADADGEQRALGLEIGAGDERRLAERDEELGSGCELPAVARKEAERLAD